MINRTSFATATMNSCGGKFSLYGSAPIASLFLSACTSRAVTLVHPASGATVEYSGSGFGMEAGWVQGYVDDCMRRGAGRGYAPLDQWTPEQRGDLERPGLLPHPDGSQGKE